MNIANSVGHCSHRLCAVVAVLTLFGASTAQAVPFTTDLSINGSVGFDTGYAGSGLTGTGTQNGSLTVTQSGASTSSSFTDSSVTGSNPLAGTLTDLGDGFGFSGTASASGANSDSTFGIGIDVGLNLANNSATDTYKVTFNIAFSNQVNASGSDAYAHSNFQVFDRPGNQTLFFTDLLTDTVYGNENGGVPTGASGGSMTENGPATFAVTLLPG